MGLLGVYRADIKAVDHAKLVPDRSPGVPVDFERFDSVGSSFRYSSPFNHRISTREPPEIIGGPAGTFPEDQFLIRDI